ncbi:polysaccharide deacetylase family protein [Arhodomonas sp. SL1]|uniref:polysaccharide deacetylase family protein n=1 Tax=Arhodomonas sp. SL1 TaxID=3425691 RepID=UPI003F883374
MSAPVHVFLTVDVEIWPPAWNASRDEVTDAFRRYIHGVGAPRDYGLGYQLRALADHGLKGVFFVEPLFASVLGRTALEEVVGIIREAGQDLQLHLHPEWLGRAGLSELPGPYRLALRELDVDGQRWLLGLGRDWLERAGASPIRALRAGSFGGDANTLRALAYHGLGLDASHSAAGPWGPLAPSIAEDVHQTAHGPVELPLTTYSDFLGRRRPLQLGSSGFSEMCSVLHRCAESGRRSAVMLSHSAELLDARRQRPSGAVVRRLHRLCAFLDRHREAFPTGWTGDALRLAGEGQGVAVTPVKAPFVAALRRYAGQFARR